MWNTIYTPFPDTGSPIFLYIYSLGSRKRKYFYKKHVIVLLKHFKFILVLVFQLDIISSFVIERTDRGKNWTTFIIFVFIVLLHSMKWRAATSFISTISYPGPAKSKIPRSAAWFSSHHPTVTSMLLLISLSFSWDQCIAILEHVSYSPPSPFGNNGAMSS